MDYNQLVQNLQNLGVTPPDIMRASLYYDYLSDASNYFTNTLQQNTPVGIGNAYPFVNPALNHTSLLNQLAEILDEYVAPAVENALWFAYQNGHGPNSNQPWTYDDYFNSAILNAQNHIYVANRNQFRTDYPICAHAISRLAQSYQENIKRCCERVYTDRNTLALFYAEKYTNIAFNSLIDIKSTGSDFHKGGAQVLILTFSVQYDKDNQVKQENLKVVYKPSDLEADCLLTGNSNAMKRVNQNFMDKSLVEIFNDYVVQFPEYRALPLKTYLILPINYNSMHGATNPIHIRDAYGYLQYINTDLEWGASEWFGFYPDAVSDFVIFATQPELKIIDEFYERCGAFAALAQTFSITDIHCQNYRVHQYDPYPIDLEISLTFPIGCLADTELSGGLGAFTASSAPGAEWVIANRNTPGRSQVLSRTVQSVTENRLYKARPGREKFIVHPNMYDLFKGFHAGMKVLREAQKEGAFDDWWTRVNDNVVVRIITFGTADFFTASRQIYVAPFEDHRGRNLALQTRLNEIILQRRTIGYEQFTANGGLPNFLAYGPGEAEVDIADMDIPVYYYRIANGQLDIVNSAGNIVPVPLTIDILENQVPTTVPCRALINRDTFYEFPPTGTNVRQNQVEILSDQKRYLQRLRTLQVKMKENLGISKITDNLHRLISF